MKLSAIVINKNAGKKLEGCFRSLDFCNELIMVDSGSLDDSVKIAKEYGAKVVKTDRAMNYSEKRNIGMKEARGEWLLYVDADERVTPKLRDEILESIQSDGRWTKFQSYKIYRKNIILGKWLKHGDWWPDPVHRLMRKEALEKWEGELHEYPIVRGEVGVITEPLNHMSKDSMSEIMANSRIFAPIEAKLMFEAHHPAVRIYHFMMAMGREFWRRGVVKMGWLDGAAGIILVFYQVFHQFWVYSLLWQMQKKIKD